MIISLRKWLERVKFILSFLLFVIVVYYLLGMISAWIEPTQRYKEPSGTAVKVFQQHDYFGEHVTMRDRLRLFLWYGE